MKPFPKVLLSVLGIALGATGALAAEADRDLVTWDASYESYVAEQTVTKYFLVIGTFRTFSGAERAASRLQLRTGLAHESEPLEVFAGQPSYAREVCDLNGWDYPCYVPRGRFDDGSYLSVEPSEGYTGMKPGYFVVIAASGSRDDVLAEQQALGKRGVRSYVASSEVWLGCIH